MLHLWMKPWPSSIRVPVTLLVLTLGATAAGSDTGSDAEGKACAIDSPAEQALSMEPRRSFDAWRADFQRQAIACGVDATVVSEALARASFSEQIIELDRRQAEFNSTFMDYIGRRVGDALVDPGRALLTRHAALLAGLEARYGVPKEILVALWGLESGFGANTGTSPVLSALATLAYEGRRRGFYQRQLLATLRLLDAEDLSLEQLRGSWAGALGQVQFMPTTFQTYAVDADGDGRRDLWGSDADALASAANYLERLGWRAGEPWGMEVILPPDFDPYPAELNVRKDMAYWADSGVELAVGGRLGDHLERLPAMAAVVLPSGIRGPAFLVFHNFDVILEWNRSIFYALAVGYAAQRLAGGPMLVGRAPPGERPLSRAEVMGLQRSLNALGFEAGEPDGMVGAKTRSALRRYQADAGLTPDAYASPEVISKVRARAIAETRQAVTVVDEAAVRALQGGLVALGYDPGPADGLLGPKTRAALQRYLIEQGEAPVASPTPALIDRIVRQSAQATVPALE
jgi:membrane-bound lytic murein transglycosylase B